MCMYAYEAKYINNSAIKINSSNVTIPKTILSNNNIDNSRGITTEDIAI